MNNGKMTRYYGKYRGTVVDNADREQRGRIQAIVPDVQGLTPMTWALPCLPALGLELGIYTVPMIGSGVWIEFEQGDPEFPICTGCFPGSKGDVPSMASAVPKTVPAITLQTPLKNGITISDVKGSKGGILIKCGTGAQISVSDDGIEISNGKGAVISLKGSEVDINSGALTIA
jgi:uncharacterized protein involved in type VI secretion and phage assembly